VNSHLPPISDCAAASTAVRRCLSLFILIGLGVIVGVQALSPAQDSARIADQAIRAAQFDAETATPSPHDPPKNSNLSPAEETFLPPSAYRRVPQHFAKVGISQTQRERIYQIRKSYRQKIAALQTQIDELATQELEACEAVLNPQQREVLERLRASNASRPKAQGGLDSPDLPQQTGRAAARTAESSPMSQRSTKSDTTARRSTP
jgi:hypothetical protein